MKISSDTLSVLKNFATINPSMIVRKGSTFNTVCPSSRVLAEAKVSEDFPEEFAIYDMAKFLSIVSLFKNPIFDFKDTHLIISADGGGGVRSVKYFYTNPEFIQNRGDKKIKMPSEVVKFSLSEEDLASVIKAASVLQVPDMCVTSNDGKILIHVCDKKNLTGNSWELVVGDWEDATPFHFWFAIDTLKMMSGDYIVSIAAKSVAKFEGTSASINYWVAMESDSTYGKA